MSFILFYLYSRYPRCSECLSQYSAHSGEIKATSDITDQSAVSGVLVIVYSHSDVCYISITITPAGQEHNIDITVTGLTGTHQGVSMYLCYGKWPPFCKTSSFIRWCDVNSTNEQGMSFCLFHLLCTSLAYTLLKSMTTSSKASITCWIHTWAKLSCMCHSLYQHCCVFLDSSATECVHGSGASTNLSTQLNLQHNSMHCTM